MFALRNGTVVGEVFQDNPAMTTARADKIPLIAKQKLVLRYREMNVWRPRLEGVGRGGGDFAPDGLTFFEGNG